MVHHETTFFHRKLWTTKPDRIRVRVPPQRLPAMGVCCMSNLIEPQQTLVFFGLFSHIWLVVWNMWIIFPHIGNFIIPTDSDIFQRGRSTTNQILIGFNIINQLFLWENQLFLWPFSSSHFHILAGSQPTLRFKSGGSLGSRTSDWKTWSWKWYRSLMNQAGVKVTRWVFYLQSDHTFFFTMKSKV